MQTKRDKTVEPLKLPRNNSEICTKCKQQDSDCWDKSYCHLVPNFGIDTNGQLEHLTCSFISWAVQTGLSVPTGEELITTNGYRVIPNELWDAIARTSEEGKVNLIERFRTRLEKLREAIIQTI